jgi:hypothetical protein
LEKFLPERRKVLETITINIRQLRRIRRFKNSISHAKSQRRKGNIHHWHKSTKENRIETGQEGIVRGLGVAFAARVGLSRADADSVGFWRGPVGVDVVVVDTDIRF